MQAGSADYPRRELRITVNLRGDDKGGNGSAGATAENSAPVKPIEVTARKLEAAYAANEAGAQMEYGDKPLLVSATIRSIDLGVGDKPYLVLDGKEMFTGPQAQLTEASQAKAPSLQKGQPIKLLCDDISEMMGTPMLENCEIQP